MWLTALCVGGLQQKFLGGDVERVSTILEGRYLRPGLSDQPTTFLAAGICGQSLIVKWASLKMVN